jgi:hypothetical protein
MNASAVSDPPPENATFMARASRLISRVTLLLLWAIAILGAYFLWSSFSEYIFEDAYITYRYADNIAQGHGFVFTSGERVLGTTAPLYTLLLALLGFLGADIPLASGLVFASSIAVTSLLGGLVLRQRGAPILGLAFALFASTGGPELYRFFGLETPFLVALLIGTAWAAISERFTLGAVLVAFAFLTRYDAALFAILYFGLLWARDRRVPVKNGLLATAIVMPWLGFAQWYFGSVFPNTLGAKAGDSGFLGYVSGAATRQWNLSLSWLKTTPVWEFLGPHAATIVGVALGIGCLAGIVAAFRMRRPMTLILGIYPLVLVAGYALIGPSLVFLWYLAPATFCALLFALIGLTELLTWIRIKPLIETALLPVLGICAVSIPTFLDATEERRSQGSQYRFRVGTYESMANFIVGAKLNDQVLLTHEPGYIAYLTDLPVIDQAGLVTKGIYFHGDKKRRTSTKSIIEEHHPGLMVTTNMVIPAQYIAVFSNATRYQLLLDREVHNARFDDLVAGAKEAGDRLEPEIESPFRFDMNRKGRHQWINGGGIGGRVGKPVELTLGGKPYTHDYMFVSKGAFGAESPSFRMDFDSLKFMLASEPSRLTVAELIVDGQPVLSATGNFDPKNPEFEPMTFDVAPWRGRVATLRFMHWGGNSKSIAFDAVRSSVDSSRRIVEDFENGADSKLWKTTFTEQPGSLHAAAKADGMFLYSSDHAAMSVGLEGAAEQTSEPFVLDHDELRFRMIDFGDESTSVSLVVGGERVRQEVGTGAMVALGISWDVAEFAGQEAVLEVVDKAPAADVWIGIDDIVLATSK